MHRVVWLAVAVAVLSGCADTTTLPAVDRPHFTLLAAAEAGHHHNQILRRAYNDLYTNAVPGGDTLDASNVQAIIWQSVDGYGDEQSIIADQNDYNSWASYSLTHPFPTAAEVDSAQVEPHNDWSSMVESLAIRHPVRS